MKKQLTRLSGLLLGATILFTSCKKDDVAGPTVSLNGGDQSIELKSVYVEQGATAHDGNDGDVSSSITTSGSVDINNAGVYTIEYTATDKAGNKNSATRNVTVKHSGNTIAGNYTVKDSCGSSLSQITLYNDNATNPNSTRVMVTKFANYSNAGVHFDISGSTGSSITVPSQTVIAGTPAATRVFSGSGTISPNGKKMTITYTEVTNGSSSTCTGIYTK